jgi:hypothetical protein
MGAMVFWSFQVPLHSHSLSSGLITIMSIKFSSRKEKRKERREENESNAIEANERERKQFIQSIASKSYWPSLSSLLFSYYILNNVNSTQHNTIGYVKVKA